MLACTYAQLTRAPSPKLAAAGSIFCHPLGTVCFKERQRLHKAAPRSRRFELIRRIVAGSVVGAGALGSPGSLKNSGPPDPEPPAPPPPLNGARLFGKPE